MGRTQGIVKYNSTHHSCYKHLLSSYGVPGAGRLYRGFRIESVLKPGSLITTAEVVVMVLLHKSANKGPDWLRNLP